MPLNSLKLQEIPVVQAVTGTLLSCLYDYSQTDAMRWEIWMYSIFVALHAWLMPLPTLHRKFVGHIASLAVKEAQILPGILYLSANILGIKLQQGDHAVKNYRREPS